MTYSVLRFPIPCWYVRILAGHIGKERQGGKARYEEEETTYNEPNKRNRRLHIIGSRFCTAFYLQIIPGVCPLVQHEGVSGLGGNYGQADEPFSFFRVGSFSVYHDCHYSTVSRSADYKRSEKKGREEGGVFLGNGPVPACGLSVLSLCIKLRGQLPTGILLGEFGPPS